MLTSVPLESRDHPMEGLAEEVTEVSVEVETGVAVDSLSSQEMILFRVRLLISNELYQLLFYAFILSVIWNYFNT